MRHKFKTVVCAVAVALSLPTAPTAVDLSQNPATYAVYDSHLDTYWMWTYNKTYTELIPSTFRCHMAEFSSSPKKVWSFEGAWRYMAFKQYAPSEWDQVKSYVKSGNIVPVGAFVDAADVLIPCTESLMHQILYGNGFYQDEFGKTSYDIFLPDCFGFGYTLPTIAAHCGIRGFSTQKFNNWGGWCPTPFSIGLWQGVDGSKIWAALKPGEYDNGVDVRSSDGDQLKAQTGVWATYDYAGTGDEGGCGNSPGSNGSVYNTSSYQMFLDLDALPQSTKSKFTVYDGELIMKTHGTGCYTAHADIKMRNRRNEILALSAERASVLGEYYGSSPYPKADIKNSWINFLWHQHHDGITGTSIQAAYTNEAIPDLDSSAAQFDKIIGTAHGAVCAKLNTTVVESDRIPVVVFNPLPFNRRDFVETSVTFSTTPSAIRVYDSGNNEVPSQVISATGSKVTIGFIAHVPPLGYEVYQVKPAALASTMATGLSVSSNSVDNQRYKVSIDNSGNISQIYDKQLQKNLLSSAARFEIRNNNPTDWPAWEISQSDFMSTPRSIVDGSVSTRILENGPARVSLEVTRSKDGSSFTHRIRLCADSGQSFVEVDNDVDWKTKQSLLTTAFPMAASNPLATYDLGIGVIARPNAGTDARYEVPGQSFADITNTDNTFGVSILTDYKRGWGKRNNSTLQLTLIHSPTDGDNNYSGDQFMHHFKYGIFGHTGNWTNGSVVAGERLNHPLAAFQVTPHAGASGTRISMLKIDPTSIALLTLKKAERSSEYVVRVREINGQRATGVSVTFPSEVKSVTEISGVEAVLPTNSATISGNSIVFDIGSFAPKTFAVSLGGMATDRSPRQQSPSLHAQEFKVALGSGRTVSFRLRNDEKVQKVKLINAAGRIVGQLSADGSGGQFHSGLLQDATVQEGVLLMVVSTNHDTYMQKVLTACR